MTADALAAGSVVAAILWSEWTLRQTGPYDGARPLLSLIVLAALIVFWLGFFVGRWTV